MRYSAPCSRFWNSSEEGWTPFRCSSDILSFFCHSNFQVSWWRRFGLLFSSSRDLKEVVQRANNTRYGLAAGVFTKNMDTANTLTRALRVGTVWVNCFDIFDAAIPFGGCKMSGIGREKGEYSLKNYLQVKAVVTPLKNPAWIWSPLSSLSFVFLFLLLTFFTE